MSGFPAGMRNRGLAEAPRDSSKTPLGEIRPALVDLFPPFRMYDFGFTEIDVPAGLTVAAKHAAWYGLGRINVDSDTGDQINYHGLHLHMLPTDPDASRGSAWGDTLGLGAAIVVGVNLPISVDRWVSKPAKFAGIDGGNFAVSDHDHLSRRFLYVATFPPGKINAASVEKAIIPVGVAPAARRLPIGRSLDVALVLNRTQALAAAGDTIGGFASVQLMVGSVTQSERWADE